MKTFRNTSGQSGRTRGIWRQEPVYGDLEEEEEPDSNSSAEYDTDLEADEEKMISARVEKIKVSEQENEGFGHVTYGTMCKSLGTLPVRKVVDQLHARELELRHVGLNNRDCKAIACALWQNTCIVSLDLHDNGLEGEDLVPIINILKSNSHIRQLSVSENEIDVLAAMAIDDVLRVTSVLSKLNLSGARIGDKEVEYIAAGMQNNYSLLWLDISHNNIGIDGAKKLGRALGDVESIQFLDLSWNHIRLSGAVALLKGIKVNKSIVDLNLSMNGLGYEGSLALEETLKENTCLRLLDISNNRINWEGVVYIARGLKRNGTLKILKMGDNPLNMEGCCVLMKAVTSRRCKLEHIGLEKIPVNGAVLCLMDEVHKTRHFTMNHGGVLDTRDVIGIRKEKPEDPISMVVRYLAMTGIRVIDMFRMFDIDNDGEVSKSEFIKGMKKIGIPLRDSALREVASRLDKSRKGVISYSILVHGVRNHMRMERNEGRRVAVKEKQKIEHQRRILQTSLPPIYKSHYEDDTLLQYGGTRSTASMRRSFASIRSPRGSVVSQVSDRSMGSTCDLRNPSQVLTESFESPNTCEHAQSLESAHAQRQRSHELVPIAAHGHRLSVTDTIHQSATSERKKPFLWLKYINLYLERRKQQLARFSSASASEPTNSNPSDRHTSNSRRVSRIHTDNDLFHEHSKGSIENEFTFGPRNRRRTQPSIYVGPNITPEKKTRRRSVAHFSGSSLRNHGDGVRFAGDQSLVSTKLVPTIED